MLQDTIKNTLQELHQEQIDLENRMQLVRQGIIALERLRAVYGFNEESAVSKNVACSETEQAPGMPRVTVVEAVTESAIAYVSEPAAVVAAQSAPELIKAHLDTSEEDTAPSLELPSVVPTVLVKHDVVVTDEDPALLLGKDITEWRPELRREPLVELYNVLLLRYDRFTKDLPPTMDLSNPQVVRTLTNHLRHEAVPGYSQLCARLKQHSHLGYLYRRARDKATGAIFKAYPELMCEGADADIITQSQGTPHFTSLANVEPVVEAAAVA